MKLRNQGYNKEPKAKSVTVDSTSPPTALTSFSLTYFNPYNSRTGEFVKCSPFSKNMTADIKEVFWTR